MKIRFTTEAQRQLELFLKLNSASTGFIVGRDIGKFKIIKNLFSAPFSRSSIDDVYREFLETIKDGLLGVFFMNRPLFLVDWFNEDIILEIKGQETKFFCCRFDPKKGRRELVNILDWEAK